VAQGRVIYTQYCASCHGASLEGQPNWQAELPEGGRPAPPHDASGHTWHHADKLLFEIVQKGPQASPLPGYIYRMPAFGEALSDEEIWAVLAYIKSTWPPETLAAQEAVTRQTR
jgi:mono/diheme cytochrome c family protein